MPKHITRLVLLMLLGAGGAYGAKQFFTADSFYRYGHYRGASVQEIAAIKPRHMGSAYCEPCHADRYAEWSKGVHHSNDIGKVVQCEVCHGVAGGRDDAGKFMQASTGTDHPASGKLAIPSDTRQLCPLCHEKTAGRPAAQRQVVIESHAGTQQCTTCHNPHSPKLMKTMAAPAAGSGPAGKAAACSGCHGSEGVSGNEAWPNLAGQHDVYLIDALKSYKAGMRDNAMMNATAKAMSDGDMQEIAKHFSGLKPNASKTSNVDTAAGKAKAAACAGCHGEAGVSANPAWPSLAGQQKGYIVAALKAYKDGTRKNDMMAPMAKALSDADIDALATYYAAANGR